jgi:hypothetical protein
VAETFAPEILLDTVAADRRFARIVTETQAEAVLAELRPWLRERPPFDQFWKQLETTVARTQAIRQTTIYWHAAAAAFSQAGRPALQAEMYFFSDPPAWGALSGTNAPERVLSMVPELLSAQQRPRKGPAPRTWYADFVRGLAKIAEGIGIKVTTAGDRTDDPHATPFTRFVFAVEKLLPREEQSPSLVACARRIDRAIVFLRQTNAAVPRKGKRRKPANTSMRDK